MNKRVLIVSLITVGALTQHALALREFKKSFEDRYVKPLEKNAQRVFRRANCNVCHVKGEKKDVHNAFGAEIAQRIQGDAKDRLKQAKQSASRDQELAQVLLELATALDQVESLPAADGTTFGDRIRSGKLPVEPLAATSDEPSGGDVDEFDEDAEYEDEEDAVKNPQHKDS